MARRRLPSAIFQAGHASSILVTRSAAKRRAVNTVATRYLKSNTPHLSEVVTNDNQIVTECIDCDHFPREGLVHVGVMLSLLRKRFIGS
jgi:hypothetical protein